MAIVDFEQDPDMPLGTGNFRDENGKSMYLSDPETASRFIKTMPGKTLGAAVGAESQAIATSTMGAAAPAAGPDLRTANNNANDTGLPTPVGDVRAPVPGMPAPAPTGAVGQAAGAAAAGNRAAVADLAANVKAAGAPAGAPGASPKAVALVKKLDQVPQKAAATPAAAAPVTGGGLPVASIDTSTSRQIVKGANRAAVEKRIGEEEGAQNDLDAERMRIATERDAKTGAAIDTQIGTAQGQIESETAEEKAQKARQAEAARLEEIKRAELKKNDEMLDPDRYMKNMSTGGKIGMVILAALNGGFGALNGQKNNGVLDVLDAEVERDIDKQKSEIAAGRVSIGNEIDKYIKMGFDAHTAEGMARDRKRGAIAALADLQAKKLGVTGENAENAKLLAQDQRVKQAQRRGDLLATTEDREQTSSSTAVKRAVPKATGGVESLLKQVQLEKAALELKNEKIQSMNAEEASKQIYGVDDKGNPKRLMTPDEYAKTQDKVATVGPALAETAGAVNMTKVLVETLGGTLNETTGEVTWPSDNDVKGAGPVDRAGGYLAVNPVTGLPIQAARALNLYRADIDKARDAQNALKEYVTSQLTGANSNLRQDQTFGSMVGGDFTNEEQTKENIQNWAKTLFASRQQHMARLGTAGMRLMEANQREADAGNGAPPLKPHAAGGK